MDYDFSLEPGKRQVRSYRNDDIKPLVSIITPYYNAGTYFEQTFLCVINQTFPWFEWIIVNDGSTNKEDVNRLEQFARRDRRITLYHKENGGISTARNMAIKNTTTDIIIPLDADDLIIPTYVECLYWGLFYNQEYDWCYTNHIGFHNISYVWKDEFDSERLKTFNFLVYSAAIRKTALKEVGGYEEATKHFYEDWHLWLKLLAAGKKPLKLSIYGFWYRRMDTGVLSLVNNDPLIKERAKQLIENAADKVTHKIEAKRYPYDEVNLNYETLTITPWEHGLVNNNITEKDNLLLLIPWMEMGGADLLNIHIVKGLDKEKYNISIITTVPGENSWRQQFEEDISEIFELPSFLDLENYLSFINYFIITRSIKTIFLSNSYMGYYMLPWLRKNHPTIIIMDYVHMEEWYWKNGGYARTAGIFQDFIDRTYTCNNRTKQVLIDKFKCRDEKVKTLYIGTDIHRFNPEVIAKGNIYERYHINKEVPIILYPCRFHPQKRPFLMLEIVKMLSQEGREFILLAVGGGDQLEEVKEKSKEMGIDKHIIFTGEQNNMPEYYQDSFITLICSIKEGIALTAYESLAMGTPVISTNVGGQKELISKDVGYLLDTMQDEAKDFDSRSFHMEEINGFTKAIEELLDNKEKYLNMCKCARDKIVSIFSLERMIENFVNEMDELKSEEYLEKRVRVSESLGMMPYYVEDAYLQYIETIKLHNQKEKIWKERIWYQNLYYELKSRPWKRINWNQNSLHYRALRKVYRVMQKVWRKHIKYTILGRRIRKMKGNYE